MVCAMVAEGKGLPGTTCRLAELGEVAHRRNCLLPRVYVLLRVAMTPTCFDGLCRFRRGTQHGPPLGAWASLPPFPLRAGHHPRTRCLHGRGITGDNHLYLPMSRCSGHAPKWH